MSLRIRVSTFACGIAAAIMVSLLASPSAAQTYTWDGSKTGSLADSSGTWDLATYNWNTGVSDVPWQNNGYNAVFGAGTPGNGSYTVTLGGNVVPTGITFTNPGYTISSDASNLYSLTLGANGITANASAAINAPITLSAAQQWSTAAGQGLTVGGNISGSGALTKVGNGTLTLSGSNSYTGGATLLGGVLSVSSLGSNLPNSSSLPRFNLTGGTLLYTGAGSDSTNALMYIPNNNATIDVLNPAANVTLANAAGASFTKTGSGTLTLPGGGYTNSMGLGVYVQQGTVVLAAPNSGAGGSHAVSGVGSVSPGATLQMASIPGGDPNGGGQIYAGVSSMNGTMDFNGMSEGLTTLNGTGTVTNNAPSTTSVLTLGYVPSGNVGGGDTFAGTIADGRGTMAVAVSGGGTFTLTGSSTYSGGTTISQGTLAIAPTSLANNPLGKGPVTLHGGVLRLASSLGSQQPLSVTGFNVDDIAEASAASPNVSTNYSFSTWNFYEKGALNSSQGLPNWGATGGTLSSLYAQPDGTHTVFKLQPYGTTTGGVTTLVNNVAVVGGTYPTSLAMTLGTPAQFNALQLLLTGQDNGNYNLTLNFAGGTTYTYNANPYWYWVNTNSLDAYENTGLVGHGNTSWGGFYNGTLSLVENDFAIPVVDQSKTLNSVTVQVTSGGGLMLFGLAGNAFAVANNVYSNAVNVTANSAIDLPLSGQVGPLSIGNNTLSITGTNGATLTVAGLSGVAGSQIALGGNVLAVNGSAGSNFPGIISGSGALSVVQAGSDTLVLSGPNTYSGNTLISSGTLALGNGLALQNSTLDTSGSGVLSFASLGSATFAGIINGGSVSLTNTASAPVALSVGNNGVSSTYAGVFSGSGSLTKIGAGTLTLGGNSSYTGGTTINQGILASLPAGPTNNPLGSGPITLNGGTLRLAVSLGGMAAGQQPLSVTGFNVDDIAEASAPSPSVATNFGQPYGWSFYEKGAPNSTQGLPNWVATGGTLSSLYAQPNGTHTVFQLQPYGSTSGTTTTLVNNVAVVGGTYPTTLTMTLKTPAPLNALQLMLTGQDSGNYNLTLNFADGTTYTSNGNPYWYWVNTNSEDAYENTGLVQHSATAWASNQFYAGTLSLVENDFTVPVADQSKAIDSVTFQVASGGGLMIFGLAGSVSSAAPNNVYSNALNVTANSTIDLESPGSTSPAGNASVGPLSIGGNVLSVTGTSGASLTTGAVTISGNATFSPAAGITLTLGALGDNGTAQTITKSNSGVLVLASPASSLTAGTQFNITAGSVSANGVNALGTLTSVDVTAGAVLNVNANQTVALLSDSGSVVLASGATLTAGAAGSSTFGGTISGNGGSLVKTGGGALLLTGSNTYSGNTTLSAGILAVNGQVTSSAVSVTGGLLCGTGTVGNLIHIQSGGALTPGYGGTGGTLSAGNFTLDSGGILNFSLATTPGNSSYLNVSSGAVTLPSSGATLNIFGSGLGVGSYPLIGYGGSLNAAPGGAFSVVNLPSNITAAGDIYSFTTTGNVIDLVIAGVTNGQWCVNSGGTWNTATNWTGGGVPASGQDTALFGTVLTGGTANVTLDSSRSLAGLAFSTTGANSYVISPSGTSTLTLASNTGTATLSDSGGNHTIAAPVTLGSSLGVTVAGGSTLTVSGAIGATYGGAALSLSGGGTLVLSGSNTYGGLTTIAAGTLQSANAAALQNSTVVLSGGSLDLSPLAGSTATLGGLSGAGNLAIAAGTLAVGNNNGSTTYSGNLSGGALAKIGGGTLVLTGAGNSYGGGTTINNGSLQIGDGSTSPGSLPGNVVISSATLGALTFNMPASASLTVGGNVSGSGGLTVTGSGLVTLSGSSSYTGPTAVSGGTLQFSSAAMQTLGGNISGSGALMMAGPGTLTLSGSNTSTGGTTLLGGVLSVASLGINLPNSASWPPPQFNLTGGTLLYTGAGSDSTNARMYISNGSATIDVLNPAANVTLVNAAGGSFTKTGSGVLTLPGGGYTNSMGLGVYVQQGTVALASPNSGSGGGHAVTNVGSVSPGATLQMASMSGGDPGGGAQMYGGVSNMNGTMDFNGMSEGLTTLNGSGTVTNNAPSTTSVLTFGYVPTASTGGADTFAGTIADGRGTLALAVSGGGALTLTGTNNTYSGGTAIYNGSLQIGDGSTSPGSLPGNVVISSATPRALNFNTPAGISLTYSGSISGSGAGGLTKSGLGTVILTGSSSYSGNTQVNSGTLTVGNPVALQNSTIAMSTGTLAFTVSAATLGGLSGAGNVNLPSGAVSIGNNNASTTYAGTLSGAGGLTKIGGGVLALGGSNTYQGPTVISSGVLQLQGVGTVPAGTKIMPVGDSITYGAGGTNAGYRGFLYSDLMATGGTFQFVGTTNGNSANLPSGPVNQTYHDGWPGWTTGDILGNSQSGSNNGTSGNIGTWLTQLATAGQSPTIITMMIGTNDPTNGGFTLSQGTSNLSAIVDTVYSKDPGVRLLLAECTPRLDGADSWVNQYNADMVGLVTQKQAAGDNIALVDLNSGFPTSTGLSSDGLHPNDTGYAWMASQWASAILGSYPAAGSVTAAIPSTSPVTVAQGATFDLNGSLATVGPLSGAGNITLGASGGLTVNSAVGNNTTFSGSISGTGALTKTGGGTLVLSGNDNFYNGGTDVDGGTLQVMTSDAIPYGSGLTVGAGGTVVFGDPLGAGATMTATSSLGASPAGAGVAAVPEPASLALLAVGAMAAAIGVWRRRNPI